MIPKEIADAIPWIVAYAILSGLITEGIMHVTPSEITKKRWAILCALGVSVSIALIKNWAMDGDLRKGILFGIIGGVLSSWCYDLLQSVLDVLPIKKKVE